MTQRPFPAYQGTEPFVFASYAHRDAQAVYTLLQGLRQRGTNVWYDEGIEAGSDWREELAAAIDGSASVVFFVSAISVASRNCLKEINFALSRDKPIVLVFLENVALPAGLEMSLGDQQGIDVQHHTPETVLEKLDRAIKSGPGKSAVQRRQSKPAPGPARWLLLATFAMAAIGLFYWNTTQGPESLEEQKSTRSGPAVIAVAPFKNLSGESDFNWFGSGLSTLVSDQLAGSRHLVMVSNSRWNNISANEPDATALREKARAADIDYLVSGEMLPSPEGMLLSVRTTDLNNGINVGAQSIDALKRETLVQVSRQVSRNIMQTLNLPRKQQLETLSADFATDDFAAYEAYLAGLHFYNRFDYDQAATSMEAALAISPDFHMANFRLANIQMSKSQWREAQETLARVPAEAPLPERERAYITGLGQMLAGEYAQAIDTFQALLARTPYDVEAQQLLAESYYRSFQANKALDVLDKLGTQEPENHHVWAAMGYMAMSLGEAEKAEQALTRYAGIAPNLPHPWQLLGTLDMLNHSTNSAMRHFNKALTVEPDFSPARLGAARAQAYLGDYPSAKKILLALVEDTEVSTKDRISAAFDLVALLQAESLHGSIDPVFVGVINLLQQEKARVALALTERAYNAMANDQLDLAQNLLSDAISQAPPEGVPTRYLFARGMLELQRSEYNSIPATVEAIRGYALPSEDPDQTEERAALLLEGLALAKQGQFDQSVEQLQKAQNTQGFEYRSVAYATALAQAGRGDGQSALSASMQAVRERPQFQAPEPRLDLEVERRRAFSLAVQLSCELDDAEAKAQLRELSVPAWQVSLNCEIPRRER